MKSLAHQTTLRSLAIAGLASLALAAPAWAGFPGGPGGWMPEPGRMMHHMADKLDLSEEQRASIEELLSAAKANATADWQRLAELREALREQHRDFDAGRAQALADELGQVSARLAYSGTETQARIYQLLTAEQRAGMDEMAARWKEHRAHRMEHRGGATTAED